MRQEVGRRNFERILWVVEPWGRSASSLSVQLNFEQLATLDFNLGKLTHILVFFFSSTYYRELPPGITLWATMLENLI